MLGLSGGFDSAFSDQIDERILRNCRSGAKKPRKFPAPNLADGMKIDIVQRETRATAISLGFPIEVNRAA